MHTVKELSWSAVARGPGSGMVIVQIALALQVSTAAHLAS